MKRHRDTHDAQSQRLPLLGLLACVLAILPMIALLVAKVLYTIGGHYRDVGKSGGALAARFGLILGAIAVLLAIVAIASGGPNRRIGCAAITLVALSLFLLLI